MPEITKVNVGGTTYDIVDNTKVSKTGDTMSGTLTIDKSGSIQFNYNDAYARLNLIGYNGTTPTSYTPRLQVLGGGGATYGVQIEGLAAPSIDSAAANKQYVDQKVASAIGDITGVEFNTDYTSYASLPATGEAGVIYLIPNSGSAPNIYDEYIYVGNGYEKIGTTDVDLSGYVAKSDVTPVTGITGTAIANIGGKTIYAPKPSAYYIESQEEMDDAKWQEIVNAHKNNVPIFLKTIDGTNYYYNPLIAINIGNETFVNSQDNYLQFGVAFGSFNPITQQLSQLGYDAVYWNGGDGWSNNIGQVSQVALTGSYNDLTDKPAIPTAASFTITYDSRYALTSHTHGYSTVTFTQTNTSGDEIGKITIDGVTTTLYADADTDTKVTQTLTTPTASATYPILFTNTASKSSTSTDTARFDTGFHYNPYFGSVFTKGPASTISSSASGYRLGLESGTQTGAFVNGVAGTTSTVGQARLFLGNDIASGTANNAEGSIMLYGSGTYYTQIKSAAADGNKAVTFPNLGGTVALLENPQTFTGAKTFSATTTLNNRIVGKIGAPSAGNYTTTVPTAAGVNGQIMFVTIS